MRLYENGGQAKDDPLAATLFVIEHVTNVFYVDLHVVGLDGKQLSVHYQGPCGTCPNMISGTLRGIENLVKSIGPDIEVVAV